LNRRQIRGVKFRFIHPLGGFLLDFFAPAVQLCVEIDGGIHDTQVEYDEERSRVLAGLGIAVVRIRNEEILHDLPGALARIEAALLARSALLNTAAQKDARLRQGLAREE
jgi:very-short-patch-repair endonuclease